MSCYHAQKWSTSSSALCIPQTSCLLPCVKGLVTALIRSLRTNVTCLRTINKNNKDPAVGSFCEQCPLFLHSALKDSDLSFLWHYPLHQSSLQGHHLVSSTKSNLRQILGWNKETWNNNVSLRITVLRIECVLLSRDYFRPSAKWPPKQTMDGFGPE